MLNLQGAEIEPYQLNEAHCANVRTDVLRLDKIHPVISGNKWFKLKYYLQEATKSHANGILTFGGPYSNHVLAAACAAHSMGLPCVGIIRGEAPASPSPTLARAKALGMQLEFMNRKDYRDRGVAGFLHRLQERFEGYQLIPEGGFGPPGAKGSAEILDGRLRHDYTHILCAVGTGTMLAGLAQGCPANQLVFGISVLRGIGDLVSNLAGLVKDPAALNKVRMVHDYHFGGYAKKNGELFRFMNDCYAQTGIPTDFVYTGKLFYAVNDLIRKGHFPTGSRLLVIHSGGLQGNDSLAPGTLIF